MKSLPAKFKPMLSGKLDSVDDAKFPLLASPKLDGIRAITTPNGLVSRNLKSIPNGHTQMLMKGIPVGLDGELIVGQAFGKDVWNRSQSGVMKRTGKSDVTFYVFDCVPELLGLPADAPFDERIRKVYDICHELVLPHLKAVPHTKINDQYGLRRYEDFTVRGGFEGVMVRDPLGQYKYGRSTAKQGWLLKLKRWHDCEAEVVACVEEMHNANAAEKDELGRTKRSSSKAGKKGKGTLGALVCMLGGVRFEIGTGFTAYQRQWMWKQKNNLVGQLAKVKYQELTPDGVPRFPVFLGFRDLVDA